MNRRLRNHLFSLLFPILGSLSIPSSAHAQFLLPSFDIIQKEGIRKFKVYRTALHFQGGLSKNREPKDIDSTRHLEATYYFNEFGKLDSILRLPSDSGYYQKEFFEYNVQKNLREYRKVDRNGNEIMRRSIQLAPNSEFLYRSWENGKLQELYKINSDSLIYEKKYFFTSDTSSYTTYTFDFINNIQTQHWKNNKGDYSIETYQWFAENGNPKSFKHTLEEKDQKTKKPSFKEKEYELDSEGNVINKYLGRFDDPYISCNYYERFERMEAIYYPEKERFKSDQLFHSKEIATLYSFDGLELVYLYELEYN